MTNLISPRSRITKFFESEEIAIVQNGNFEFFHDFGVMPKHVDISLICKADNSGYLAGDVVFFGSVTVSPAPDFEYVFGVGLKVDSSSVKGKFGNGSAPDKVFSINSFNSVAAAYIGGESWRVKFKVFA